MHIVRADIDELLQTTADVEGNSFDWNLKEIEIDELLETTKNWSS
ncbi:hypothetical protein [Niallia sp. NCCP-28]|nr:hypothetical protein [Niallia sp. NCCP-28]GKU82876.1 hypothetical protein NCCP28_22720 [Niallia sp. NCCP-28]